VLSSPEPKAMGTAEPLAVRSGVEIEVDARLREVEREPNLPDYAAHRDAVRRYLEGERPAPREASSSPLAAPWAATRAAYADAIESCLLHEALVGLWAFVAAANKLVDAEQPWVLAKAAAAGDAGAEARLRGVLGDLVEAARLIGLAAAPFLPGTAPRVSEQLGYAYPYAADGNGGPPLLDELEWGRHAGEPGSLGTAAPLFPRLDVDSTPA